jgi:nucleotide-binding universal stress UspA family protein
MKILIAVDGSECSAAAIRDLALAGLPDEAEAVVVSVAEYWLPPPSPGELLAPAEEAVWTPDMERASDVAAAACDRVARMFPRWDVRAAVFHGSPAAELLAHADEFGPDLIVAGSHGRGTLARLALGSVSQRLAVEATCSVRVARPRVGSPSSSTSDVRLLIGLDDSAEAQGVVREVARRRWVPNTEVLLLTVFDRALVGRPELDRELSRIDQFQLLAERMLTDAGLAVSRLTLAGDPKRLLADEAARWDADCVFVSSRGLGRVRRALLGSVAAAVTARAQCSVEVVRAHTAASAHGARR